MFTLTALLATSVSAGAGTITYMDRLVFEATLGTSVTDNYSAAGYQEGDKRNIPGTNDIFSNAAVSAVLGETDYRSTNFTDYNMIANDSTNDYYCAGCNGSFRLTFDSTSVGTGSGVYGAGFNFFNTGAYHAFVTFGDASTASYQLPFVGKPGQAITGFFGITSDLGISSIHLGLADGGRSANAVVGIDNLTIGAQAAQPLSVPDPASAMTLLVLGLTGLAVAKRHMTQRP